MQKSKELVRRTRISAKFLLPAQDAGYIPFFFSIFDATLGLIEHGQAGMSENVILVDFDELFRSCDRLLYPAAVEQSHAQPVQRVLIVGINLQCLLVMVNRLVQLLVAKRINGLLK